MIYQTDAIKEGETLESHHTFRNSDGLKTTVPKKGGKMVKRVYIQQIVKLLNLEGENNENAD